MKRIRIMIIAALLLTTGTMYGVTSFFELSLGGGWSSMGYGLNNETQPLLNMQQNGSYGLNAHLGYGLQFTPYVALSIGADISRYGGNATMSGDAIWQGVMDTEGEKYDHITTIHQWADQQNLWTIEVPLSLYLRFALTEDVRLYGQVGAKACIPLMSGGQYSGSLTHRGGYEPWMLELGDMPNHGFYSSSMQESYELKGKFAVAGFVKIGVEAPVDEYRHVWLFGALYGTMYFTPVFETAPTGATIGWRNDTENTEQYQAHYFMNDYAPVFTTTLATGTPKPFAVGAEIGIRYRIPHPKHYRCNCNNE